MRNRLGKDLVAQLVEHSTFNAGVPGSSPGGVTNFLIMLKFNIKVLQPDEECPLKYGNCAGCPYFGTVVDEGIVCYADEEPSQEN